MKPMQRSLGVAVLLLSGMFTAAQAGQPYRGPQNAFQLRMGYHLPSGGGTLWDDVEERFTLDSSDFDDFAWGVSFVGSISPQVEVGFHVDWYEETVRSQERDYVDTDGFPILHDTTFSEVPIGVDLRFVPGGRRPGKVVFYFGVGACLNLWDYDEYGDFVNEDDPQLPIYYGEFEASGESLEGRVLAGLEFPVSPAFNVIFEGRYTFADEDQSWLGTVETGGTWLFAGTSFRF